MAERVAGARDMALNEMNFRGISINTAETAITLVPSDSGIMFVNIYDPSETMVTYTLPAVADGKGKMFIFLNASNGGTSTVFNAPTACIKGRGTPRIAFRTQNRGEWAIVVGDGTYYYLFSAGFDNTYIP